MNPAIKAQRGTGAMGNYLVESFSAGTTASHAACGRGSIPTALARTLQASNITQDQEHGRSRAQGY